MDAAQKMQLFENLTLVFTAIAIIGLALAIFFFFFFDIRNVYALRTGKAKRQTIERINANNRRTGRLQATTASVRDPSVPVVQLPTTEDISPNAGTGRNDTVGLGDTLETEVLGSRAVDETTILGGMPETTVLNAPGAGADETQVLSAVRPAEPAKPVIRFDVTENTLVIHTNEII